MTTVVKQQKTVKLGNILLIIVWLFLFTEYMLRISDSAIIPELSAAFHINASGIGLLSSSYYFIYAVMQIPAGLLLDRFGLVRVLAIAIFILALSAFLMGSSPNFFVVIVARLLMGASSAFAFIGGLKIIAVYLKTDKRSLWIGVTMTIATLGAVSGQEPWLLLANALGSWRYAYYLLGVIVLLVSFWTFSLFRWKVKREVESPNVSKTEVKLKLLDKKFLSLLIYIGFLSAPITVFAAFWAVPFFYQGLNFDRHVATSLSSLGWIGGLFGGPLLGFVADYFHQRKQILVVAGLVAALIVASILFLPMSPLYIGVLLFLLGILCNAHVIIFAQVSETVPKSSVGLFMGIINTCNILITPILQLSIGFILALQQVDLEAGGGSAIQHLSTFQFSLLIMPALLVLATINVAHKLR